MPRTGATLAADQLAIWHSWCQVVSMTHKPAVVDLIVAGGALGMGRSACYAAAAHGQLCDGVPILRIGIRRYGVPTAALERALCIDLSDLLAT